MSNTKVSGGYARVAQVLILLIFIPLVSILSFGILTNNFTSNGITFLFAFIAGVVLILWNVFSYSDVYLSDDFIVAKALFTTKRKNRNEVRQVIKALRPFTYRIKFNNGEKVTFLSTVSDTLKQFLSSDSDITLTAVKTKITPTSNDQ